MDVNDDNEDGVETRKKKNVLFAVENKQTHYDRVQMLYRKHPRPKQLMHTAVGDRAIQFWRKGLPWSYMLLCVDCNTPLTIATQHPGLTNVITNILCLRVDEVDCGSEGDGSRAMIRPEQKNTALMLDLIRMFSQPGQLVLEPLAGTFSTAMGCLL